MGRYSGKRCRLLSMFTMTAGFFLVEIVVGYATNSMALVADSFHMLSDVAALIIAFLSVRMSPKKWSKNTFGWARAEVLGALVNSVFLVALCFSIFVESMKRFYEVEEIYNPQMILIVGTMGLAVNVIGLVLFHEHGGSHGHSHGGRHRSLPTLDQVITEDLNLGEVNLSNMDESPPEKHQHNGGGGSSQMNMRGVFLHVMADALGSVIVIISAVVIWKTDFEYKFYIDPALSVVMVILILRSVWPLLIDSALILLQTVPTHIQVDDIQKKLLRTVDGVLAVHEFHVWQLAGDRIIASAHIRCRNLSDYMKIAEKVKEFFHNEGIHSTTIQPEFVEEQVLEREEKSSCVLDCPPNTQCSAQTCCGPQARTDNLANDEGMSIRQRSNASVSAESNTGSSNGGEDIAFDGRAPNTSSSAHKDGDVESDVESGQLLNDPQNYGKIVIS